VDPVELASLQLALTAASRQLLSRVAAIDQALRESADHQHLPHAVDRSGD
jgi:hypothetical protein